MNDPNILIFGAGKIGRSFIGQLFSRAGYRVVFVDMDMELVNRLNMRGQYPVVIKGSNFSETIQVKNVNAIDARDREKVISALKNASVAAISVGKSALPAVAPVLAEGLLAREMTSPGSILDVILAENMRSADLFLREKLRNELPGSFPLDDQLGLVETSIGKMVPIMTSKDLEGDPLQVFAEPYNTLILDRQGFRGKIPDIPEFALKKYMKAWVDRKAFIHNLGHATAAYYGYLRRPDSMYMYEVLSDPEVHAFTQQVMIQSARILRAAYPGEYSENDLLDHIDDLLERFRNRNLGDTVYRVGSDLYRKLSHDDRFMGIIRMAQQKGKPCDLILEALAMGFLFRAGDESGVMFVDDQKFHHSYQSDPEGTLLKVTGLDNYTDAELLIHIKSSIQKYESLQ